MDNRQLSELIKNLYQKKEYRPVGVGVLYRVQEKNEFLITQSAKVHNVWSFPQGGIDLEETLAENLYREMGEELGISFGDLRNQNYSYHYETLDAESTRKDKRGFSKGKAYFFNLAEYQGDGNLRLKPDEIAAAKWMDYTEAIKYFNLGRPEKAALSKRALDKAIEILTL